MSDPGERGHGSRSDFGGRRGFDRPIRKLGPPQRAPPPFPVRQIQDGGERQALIEKQLKFYFSDENMYFDDNLRQLSERRRGFVPINALLFFRTLFSLKATAEDLERACQSSLLVNLVELSQAADMIRRREPLSQAGWDSIIRRTLFLSRLSGDASQRDYTEFFNRRLKSIDENFEVTAVRLFPSEPGTPFVPGNVSCNSPAAAAAFARMSPIELSLGAPEPYSTDIQLVNGPGDKQAPLWLPHNNWVPQRPPPQRPRGGRGGRGGGRGGGGRGDRGGRGRRDDFGGRGGGRGQGFGRDDYPKRDRYDGRDDRFGDKRGRF